MSFESRQRARQRTIDRIVLGYKMLGLVYMALHITVAALAFKLSGASAAVLTLLTLGLGDLYWAVTWGAAGEYPWPAAVASFAALLCFFSWGTRPYFNRWAAQFTSQMLSDTAAEIEQITQTRKSGDAADDPGGDDAR
jgi:hypothetical protein